MLSRTSLNENRAGLTSLLRFDRDFLRGLWWQFHQGIASCSFLSLGRRNSRDFCLRSFFSCALQKLTDVVLNHKDCFILQVLTHCLEKLLGLLKLFNRGFLFKMLFSKISSKVLLHHLCGMESLFPHDFGPNTQEFD